MTRPYAEAVNYWKSGTSSPDTWMDKTVHAIREVGGIVTGRAALENVEGAAFTILFTLAGESYRVNWPVLALDPAKRRSPAQLRTDERAAKTQAATFLYHDIKARCMVVKIMGPQAAFLQYRLPPGGMTAAEMGFEGQGADIPFVQLMLGSGS